MSEKKETVMRGLLALIGMIFAVWLIDVTLKSRYNVIIKIILVIVMLDVCAEIFKKIAHSMVLLSLFLLIVGYGVLMSAILYTLDLFENVINSMLHTRLTGAIVIIVFVILVLLICGLLPRMRKTYPEDHPLHDKLTMRRYSSLGVVIGADLALIVFIHFGILPDHTPSSEAWTLFILGVSLLLGMLILLYFDCSRIIRYGVVQRCRNSKVLKDVLSTYEDGSVWITKEQNWQEESLVGQMINIGILKPSKIKGISTFDREDQEKIRMHMSPEVYNQVFGKEEKQSDKNSDASAN